MLPHHNTDFCWYNDLKEPIPHYTPVKVFSILEFYTLKPRASALTHNNIVPIQDVKYAYKAPTEEKYYLKRFRNHTYDEIVSSDDEAIKVLRQRVEAGQVWLMLTLQNISDTTETLKRVWNGHYSEKGKLDYRDFIALLKLSLQQRLG